MPARTHASELNAGATHNQIQPQVIAPRLLTVADAARYLGRTEKSIRHLVQRRKLASIRGDGRVMFDRVDLDAWIKRNRA
jgi:excisionase family DNA binding protein